MDYPVFTLGTGRCGTKAMATLLHRAGFHSLHEGACLDNKSPTLPPFTAHPHEYEYNAAAFLTRIHRHRDQLREHGLRLHEAAPQFWLVSHLFTKEKFGLFNQPEPKVIHLVRDPVSTVESFCTKFPGIYAGGIAPQWSSTAPVGTWFDTLPQYEGLSAAECWAQYYQDANAAIAEISIPRWVFRTEWLSDLKAINELLRWIDSPNLLSAGDLPIKNVNARTKFQKQRGSMFVRESAESAVKKYVRDRH